MKKKLSLAIAVALLLGSPSCIYVNVTGDFEELIRELDEDDEFPDLVDELEECLHDPEFDLDVHANLWKTEAEWTVRYSEEGSDDHTAFRRAKQSILARVERKGGALTREVESGPHAWECAFDLNDSDGEASVRLVEGARGADRGSLEIVWKESN